MPTSADQQRIAFEQRWREKFRNMTAENATQLQQQYGQEKAALETRLRGQAQGEQLVESREQKLLGDQKTQFGQARSGFKRKLNLAVGQQVGQARRAFTQSVGRRGLTGSGIEQAGLQAVQAAGATQSVQSLADFETKLNLAQESERAQFRQASFSFLSTMVQMATQGEMEMEMMRFQAQLAADQQSSQIFMDILNTGAQVAALAL